MSQEQIKDNVYAKISSILIRYYNTGRIDNATLQDLKISIFDMMKKIPDEKTFDLNHNNEKLLKYEKLVQLSLEVNHKTLGYYKKFYSDVVGIHLEEGFSCFKLKNKKGDREVT